MWNCINKRSLKRIACVAAGYFLVAEISLILSTNNVSTAIVWPAAGFAFAMFLHYGIKIWPAIAIGSLLANTHYLLGRDPSLSSLIIANIGIAIGNVLGPWAGVKLVKSFGCAKADFSKQKFVVVFALPGAIPAAAIAAFFGAISIFGTSLGTEKSFLIDWQQWAVSDIVGIIVLTPAILLWFQEKSVKLNFKKSIEAALVTLLIFFLGVLIFGPLNKHVNHSLVRPFLIIIPLIWGATRFKPRAVALWNVFAFTILWLGTCYNYGHYSFEMLPQPLVPVQLFLGIVGFTILLLCSTIEELNNAHLVLIDNNLNLEKRVIERTHNLHESEQNLRKAKDRAEEATKLKDKFLSIVSHDLRGPISTISGVSDFLKESCVKCDNKDMQELAGLIKSTSEDLQKMISQLLDIGRLKTGKLVPINKFVNLRDTVSAQIDGVSYVAIKKSVKIKNDIPLDMRIYADPALFACVLRNILFNAVKFCRKDDVVRVYCSDYELQTVAVEDSGVGVRPDLIPNLFRHEVKTCCMGTDHEKGTGLGLPYCSDIMDAHGGEISVESVYGKGSTFFLQLPLTTPVVIVADSREENRKLLIRYLNAIAGLEIMEAKTGKDALTILDNTLAHLIFVDIHELKTDGLQFIDKLKKDTRLKNIPIIALVSDSMEIDDAKVEAFIMGLDDFIYEPLDQNNVSAKTKIYLS